MFRLLQGVYNIDYLDALFLYFKISGFIGINIFLLFLSACYYCLRHIFSNFENYSISITKKVSSFTLPINTTFPNGAATEVAEIKFPSSTKIEATLKFFLS